MEYNEDSLYLTVNLRELSFIDLEKYNGITGEVFDIGWLLFEAMKGNIVLRNMDLNVCIVSI